MSQSEGWASREACKSWVAVQWHLGTYLSLKQLLTFYCKFMNS